MIEEIFLSGNPIYHPSHCWQKLNRKNALQIEEDGYENFKRTVAQNYFTWVIGKGTDQYEFLKAHTRLRDWPAILRRIDYDDSLSISKAMQRDLCVFTRMLWKYARRCPSGHLLDELQEPTEGNPFAIHLDGKLISQDLANSVLEYSSICEAFQPAATAVTIYELGAGYGRNAFVLLHALPSCRYVVIDIPPAISIAQRYLMSVFPDAKVFECRNFTDYESIREEFESSRIAFLLPHQADLLPAKSADLFLNISSLHEMTEPQIAAYFAMIERLTRGQFYFKQWRQWVNPDDNRTATEHDYPIPASWVKHYHRPCNVQVAFFEAMYNVL